MTKVKVHKSKASSDNIAKRLRDIRINARLTQREMGEIVGLSSGSVGALENNLYTPNFDVLRAIHNRFNVSYEYIIDGTNTTGSHKEIESLRQEVERLRRVVDKLVK